MIVWSVVTWRMTVFMWLSIFVHIENQDLGNLRVRSQFRNYRENFKKYEIKVKELASGKKI